MRWLIDGYNVMHAGGKLAPKLSREGFRRARRRFLDDVSATIGPDRAREMTIVFDASAHPGDFSLDAKYKGLSILFALGDENADARIELLIEQHAKPKLLTVVSSDQRIRQAARRSRAKSLTADQFWVWLDDLKERGRIAPQDDAPAKPLPQPSPRQAPARLAPARPSPAPETPANGDDAYWLEAFREIDTLPEVREAAAADKPMLTSADIAEIERQIQSKL